MNNERQILLQTLLTEWFKEEIKNDSQFWNKNKVAVILKNNLKLLDRWKQKRRGKSFNKGNNFRFSKESANNW